MRITTKLYNIVDFAELNKPDEGRDIKHTLFMRKNIKNRVLLNMNNISKVNKWSKQTWAIG